MSTTPNFSINVVPKSKEEITNYKNFVVAANFKFKDNEGKILYTNFHYPGKHIYTPYYVTGEKAVPLLYNSKDNYRETPVFSLQELTYEDTIIFYTIEEAKSLK